MEAYSSQWTDLSEQLFVNLKEKITSKFPLENTKKYLGLAYCGIEHHFKTSGTPNPYSEIMLNDRWIGIIKNYEVELSKVYLYSEFCGVVLAQKFLDCDCTRCDTFRAGSAALFGKVIVGFAIKSNLPKTSNKVKLKSVANTGKGSIFCIDKQAEKREHEECRFGVVYYYPGIDPSLIEAQLKGTPVYHKEVKRNIDDAVNLAKIIDETLRECI